MIIKSINQTSLIIDKIYNYSDLAWERMQWGPTLRDVGKRQGNNNNNDDGC